MDCANAADIKCERNATTFSRDVNVTNELPLRSGVLRRSLRAHRKRLVSSPDSGVVRGCFDTFDSRVQDKPCP